jgi:hypothetical protein
MRTKKKDWAKYLSTTSRGETKKVRNTTLQGEPGTLMLDQDHEDCERAWAVMVMGVINVLSHTNDTSTKWQQAYANWLTIDRIMTIGITEIKGLFPKQKRHEDTSNLWARVNKQEDKLTTALKLSGMSADIPTGSGLVGNLVAAADNRNVNDMRKQIRDAVTRKETPKTMTVH